MQKYSGNKPFQRTSAPSAPKKSATDALKATIPYPLLFPTVSRSVSRSPLPSNSVMPTSSRALCDNSTAATKERTRRNLIPKSSFLNKVTLKPTLKSRIAKSTVQKAPETSNENVKSSSPIELVKSSSAPNLTVAAKTKEVPDIIVCAAENGKDGITADSNPMCSTPEKKYRTTSISSLGSYESHGSQLSPIKSSESENSSTRSTFSVSSCSEVLSKLHNVNSVSSERGNSSHQNTATAAVGERNNNEENYENLLMPKSEVSNEIISSETNTVMKTVNGTNQIVATSKPIGEVGNANNKRAAAASAAHSKNSFKCAAKQIATATKCTKALTKKCSNSKGPTVIKSSKTSITLSTTNQPKSKMRITKSLSLADDNKKKQLSLKKFENIEEENPLTPLLPIIATQNGRDSVVKGTGGGDGNGMGGTFDGGSINPANIVMTPGTNTTPGSAGGDNNNNMDNTSEESNPVTIYRCRAPIASLDCMEEFSGTGGHLDFGRSISLGSNPALPMRHGSMLTPGLRYKNLGKSGLRVSNVGLGTWPVFSPGVNEEQAEAILKLAIESGINLFDISESHSEEQIGKILQRTGWKRSTYVITTKVYWNTKSDERGLSRKHIIECVKTTLQRLQLAYIDIVIIHKADPMCPMEEVVRAMHYVIRQGWAMYWGTARWTHVEIMEAYTNCRQFNCITPIVEQSEYHMFCRDKCELYIPEMYNKIGVGLMAWGPLSMALHDTQNGEKILFPKSTFKTKSYSWNEDEVNRNATSPQGSWSKDRLEEGRRHSDRLRDISALAEKLGCTPTQLSIAWTLKHEPVQCLLLSATSTEQLHQSLQSLQLLPRLTSSVIAELERILENKPVRPPMISTLALR